MEILTTLYSAPRFHPGRKPHKTGTGKTVPRWSSLTAILVAVLLISTVAPVDAQPASVGEYELKAAYLFNFARFVQWPRETMNKNVIVIGILGEDPFGRIIEEIVEGETAQGRPIKIERFTEVPEQSACHILFISKSEKDRLDEIINQLRGQPVLTVGETEDFARMGGMVNFIFEGKKIRFQINNEAAEDNNIKIKSQLLKLAQIVKTRSNMSK